jgi:hypothetical protein
MQPAGMTTDTLSNPGSRWRISSHGLRPQPRLKFAFRLAAFPKPDSIAVALNRALLSTSYSLGCNQLLGVEREICNSSSVISTGTSAKSGVLR